MLQQGDVGISELNSVLPGTASQNVAKCTVGRWRGESLTRRHAQMRTPFSLSDTLTHIWKQKCIVPSVNVTDKCIGLRELYTLNPPHPISNIQKQIMPCMS